MATTTGSGGANTLVFTRGSHFKFAEQVTKGTQIMDEDEFSRYFAAINSGSFQVNSTLIQPGTIPTTIEPFPGVAGPATISGTFTMDAVPKRMELLFRQFLNAPTAGIAVTDADAGTPATDLISSAESVPAPSARVALSEPSQIKVTVTGTITINNTAISTTNPLKLLIKGEDINGNLITNELTFTANSGAGSMATTGSYYSALSANGIIACGTTTGVMVVAEYNTPRGSVSITSRPNYRQTPGLTVEFVQGIGTGAGTVTSTSKDAYISSFSMNATRDAIATYTFGLVSNDFQLGLNPKMECTPLTRGSSDGTGPYGSGAFEAIQSNQTPFAGLAIALYGDTPSGTEVRLPQIESMTINSDNGTAYTGRVGSPFPGVVFNGVRTTNLEWTMEFHSDDLDIIRAYLDERTWDDVRVIMTRLGGGNEITEFNFAKLQFTEYPTTTIDNTGYIRMTVRAQALPSTPTAVDSFTINTAYTNITTIPSARLLTTANLDLGSLS